MTDVVEQVVLGTAGKNCLVLQENGQAVDITALTRAQLDLGDDDSGAQIVLDSDVDAGVFDWTTSGAEGKLLVTLGNNAKLTKPGRYLATLTVEDPVNYPSPGLTWIHRKDLDSRLVFQVQPAPGS